MEQDALLHVEVATVRAVVGEVQGADGQHGAHDVVAGHAQLDDIIAPKGPDTRVGRQGAVGLGGEVVEELELEEREHAPFGQLRGRVWLGGRRAGGGYGRAGLCFRGTARTSGRAGLEERTFDAVGYAIEACRSSLVALCQLAVKRMKPGQKKGNTLIFLDLQVEQPVLLFL